MNGGADELARDVAWKLSVGVERDHVTDRLQQRVICRADDETRIRRAAQQSIELFEVSTFAFPAHPFAFTFIPQSSSVKEMEALVTVVAVQAIDPALCDREET